MNNPKGANNKTISDEKYFLSLMLMPHLLLIILDPAINLLIFLWVES